MIIINNDVDKRFKWRVFYLFFFVLYLLIKFIVNVELYSRSRNVE